MRLHNSRWKLISGFSFRSLFNRNRLDAADGVRSPPISSQIADRFAASNWSTSIDADASMIDC